MRLTAAVVTSSRLVSASWSAVAVSPATIVFVAIGQESPRSNGSRHEPSGSLARGIPRKNCVSVSGQARFLPFTHANLVEGGHQGHESPFGFAGQALRGVFPRQIDLFAQAI